MAKRLVFVGGGHAHLTCLKNLHEFGKLDHNITLISPSPFHYYSGMGPGMLSGIYRPQEVRFNIKKMAEDRGELEANAYDLHLRMRVRLEDPRGKEVFTVLSHEEKGHLDRLSSLLEQKT